MNDLLKALEYMNRHIEALSEFKSDDIRRSDAINIRNKIVDSLINPPMQLNADGCLEHIRSLHPITKFEWQDHSKLGSISQKPWVGKLRQYDGDWGEIVDGSSRMIMSLTVPALTPEQKFEHRRNGTDPTQTVCDAILESVNGYWGEA